MNSHHNQVNCYGQIGAFQININCQIPQHGITALCGKSGSGKTSLLRALSGFEKKLTCEFSKNEKVFFVHQHSTLLPHKTVQHSFEFLASLQNITKEKIIQIQSLFSLQPFLKQMPQELSGGQKKRVALALAFASNAKTLLLDEPFAGLDNNAQHQIIKHIHTLQKQEKRCIIFSSHHLREIIELADSTLCLKNGENIGPCKNISNSFQHLEEIGLDHAKHSSLFIGTCRNWNAESGIASLSNNAMHLSYPCDAEPLYETRLLLYARDISLSREKLKSGSSRNSFEFVIENISQETKASVLITGSSNGQPIKSLITRESCKELKLELGQQVWGHIKSTALLD